MNRYQRWFQRRPWFSTRHGAVTNGFLQPCMCVCVCTRARARTQYRSESERGQIRRVGHSSSEYILITNLTNWLFIHKILFSSTCFEPQVLIFRRIKLYTCSIWYCHSLWEFVVACRYTAWVLSDRRFWFSYIHFITIIGGILVLFIYIARLASNEIRGCW